MQNHLDDSVRSLNDIARDLITLASDLDHRHRQQRKVQFLLDIRGYFAMNKIKGNYVEFGLYRGEMMFSAYHILDRLGVLHRYVGFDNFTGEPEMSQEEQARLPFLQVGDYRSNEQETRSFLLKQVGEERLSVVVGDFRESAIRSQMPIEPVAIGVVDCNLPSSIEAALDSLMPAIAAGGILFLDDYFLNLEKTGLWHEALVNEVSERYGRRLVYFQTYAPCAQAFLVFDK